VPAPSDDLSRDTLERLVGRAAELDARAAERVSLAEARAIALELGISATAWDAAVAERRGRSPDPVVSRGLDHRAVRLLTAGAGFIAGALGGWLNRMYIGDADVAYGALLVLGAVGLAAGFPKGKAPNALLNLAAWWLPIPAGMMLAMSEFLSDPLWFAASGWLGTAVLAWAFPHLRRLVRTSPGPTTIPSA